MKLLGIPLRKPTSGEVTASMVMGTGLFIAVVGVMHAIRFPLERADAGALLLVVMWACLSARVGIRIGEGQRHLAANLVVSGLLLALYEAVRSFAA